MYSDVEEHAKKEREQLEIPGPAPNRVCLGLIVKESWGEKVKKVRRGSRSDRKNFFLNVAHKQCTVRSSEQDLTLEFEELAKDDSFILPKGWFKIVDSQHKISLVHPEAWEFDNQRIYTEISMELSTEKNVVYVIKSHGSKLNIVSKLNVDRIIQDLTIKAQAETLLNFVECSKLCLGWRSDLSGLDESIMALLAHKAGVLKSLSDSEILPQNGVFSTNCQLFSQSGTQCSKCTILEKIHRQRKCRKEKRKSLSKYCNKRYLTKEDIQLQLDEEKKLNRKLVHQQEKRERQGTESEDDDNDEEEEDGDDDDDEEEDDGDDNDEDEEGEDGDDDDDEEKEVKEEIDDDEDEEEEDNGDDNDDDEEEEDDSDDNDDEEKEMKEEIDDHVSPDDSDAVEEKD